MKNIATLQRIVNDIGRDIGRIDNIDKYATACAMADDLVKDEGLMAEILHEALGHRFTRDLKHAVKQVMS